MKTIIIIYTLKMILLYNKIKGNIITPRIILNLLVNKLNIFYLYFISILFTFLFKFLNFYFFLRVLLKIVINCLDKLLALLFTGPELQLCFDREIGGTFSEIDFNEAILYVKHIRDGDDDDDERPLKRSTLDHPSNSEQDEAMFEQAEVVFEQETQAQEQETQAEVEQETQLEVAQETQAQEQETQAEQDLQINKAPQEKLFNTRITFEKVERDKNYDKGKYDEDDYLKEIPVVSENLKGQTPVITVPEHYRDVEDPVSTFKDIYDLRTLEEHRVIQELNTMYPKLEKSFELSSRRIEPVPEVFAQTILEEAQILHRESINQNPDLDLGFNHISESECEQENERVLGLVNDSIDAYNTMVENNQAETNTATVAPGNDLDTPGASTSTAGIAPGNDLDTPGASTSTAGVAPGNDLDTPGASTSTAGVASDTELSTPGASSSTTHKNDIENYHYNPSSASSNISDTSNSNLGFKQENEPISMFTKFIIYIITSFMSIVNEIITFFFG
uniref:hypothetical protein n=1 Tax=Fomitopsis dickinsii TaxID=3151107 RepID=UPI002A8411E1|nr:hypothetical protein UYH45_mgp09 [Daedalea dickinsii]WNZ34361.1 hypothetical protein [Daedalea dickinsii]